MTKTTTNLLLMLITILAGVYFYVMYCSSCGASGQEEPMQETVTAPVTPKATSYPFALSNGAYAYNTNDNYNFNVSSSSFLTPLSQNVIDGISSLRTFFAENTGKVINITGYYTSDENNNTAYPDLGFARAIAVKNHMAEIGIPSNQINTTSKLMDEMIPQEAVYLGPVSFSIGEKAEDEEAALKVLYEKVKANPLVLYFDTAETTIDLTMEQRQEIADISRYLDKVADAKVIIVGHTDDTGDAENNMVLGQNRADFAKDYLMRNGISAAKISSTSKGQTEPIASNATEEGKAKNRRTVVTLN